MPPTPRARPWFREPWPWIVMAGPAAVIAAGLVTTAIAFAGADGLVADDYYKQGVSINRTLAREDAAKRLGVQGHVRFEEGLVRADLDAREPLPERLRLTLAHATREAGDRVVYLARGTDGTYSAPLARLARGRWSVIVETDRWRVASFADLRHESGVRLDATHP